MKWIKKIIKYSLILAIIVGLGAVASNFHVKSTAKAHIYSSVTEIPKNDVGVVLGTSKYVVKGGINPYFKFRMDAAWKLYRNNKIRHIIVSGDNHKDGYNEPQQMKEYLVKLGVPARAITLDYAGFRTFDSMIRANEVFGQQSFTIISQKFHNERAVFIAKSYDIDVVAFNAKSPYLSRRMRIREFLAKCKAVLDIYMLKTKPKFLGEKIEIDL